MKMENSDTAREQATLKKEQAYIRKLLGVEDEENDSAVETTASVQEGYVSSCDELDDDADKPSNSCPRRARSILSSDGGYISSSDEDKVEEKPTKSVSFVVDLSDHTSPAMSAMIDKFNLHDVPFEVHEFLTGLDVGLPNDLAVSIDIKPEWLDMKKFKIGQLFAQKYYFGLNYAEMLSLLILFALPDGLQPLIFTNNSSTPFTAFKRYLSTALRVQSWYDTDIWTEGTLGYRNLKTVRAMHLNVSKRMNSVPYQELKNQLTLWGSTNTSGVWCPLKEQIAEDFKSGCPFAGFRPYEDNRPGKVFVSQLDMSITQFGFVGLMITFPEKFGAKGATEEELDGFVHLWRGIGYLLGIEDKYNFCNGTLLEVRQRCYFVIEQVAKPSLKQISEDWEHMCRCMIEGIGFYTPGLSFEVSLKYLSWVLELPCPRLSAALTWWQRFMFQLVRCTMCFTLWLPGMGPLHNWLVRSSMKRAVAYPPERLKELENRTYDYERRGKFNTRL